MSQPTGTQPAEVGAAPAAANGARTPEQIDADLAATRERLAATIDSLVDRAHPVALARRGADGAKGWVVDESGALRTERIVKIAAGVTGTVLTLALLRKVVRRRK